VTTGAGSRGSWTAKWRPSISTRIDQPLFIACFPDGGRLSIEFTEEAPDDDEPRLGGWLELRVEDPEAVTQKLVDAGFTAN
jgi:hypothetical protein